MSKLVGNTNDSRARRILNALATKSKDKQILEGLGLPTYESTKGLHADDISKLLNASEECEVTAPTRMQCVEAEQVQAPCEANVGQCEVQVSENVMKNGDGDREIASSSSYIHSDGEKVTTIPENYENPSTYQKHQLANVRTQKDGTVVYYSLENAVVVHEIEDIEMILAKEQISYDPNKGKIVQPDNMMDATYYPLEKAVFVNEIEDEETILEKEQKSYDPNIGKIVQPDNMMNATYYPLENAVFVNEIEDEETILEKEQKSYDPNKRKIVQPDNMMNATYYPLENAVFVNEIEDEETILEKEQKSYDPHKRKIVQPDNKIDAAGCSTEKFSDSEIDDDDSVKDQTYSLPDSFSDEDNDGDISSNSDGEIETESLVPGKKESRIGLSKPLDKTSNTTQSKKNKNFCYYCESLVFDFSRHVIRNHASEICVQKIIATKKGYERNNLISELRKRGNYINASCGQVKPVKKLLTGTSPSKVKPCPYCHGFYARKQLWRHKKSCTRNASAHAAKGGDFEIVSGLLLTKEQRKHADLITKVFPRMQDNLPNKTAKKDELICEFGSKFLKTHKQKHQMNTCSRKMRELSFVLLEMQKLDPSIKNLMQALKPEHFDNLVIASKNAAGFDQTTGKYRDNAFAMNISTSLKDCCEIAILEAIKKKHTRDGAMYTQIESELKTTILLIKSNWKTEISHEASNCMYENKMQKVSLVPLASDLKTLRDFLIDKGKQSCEELKNDPYCKVSFSKLVDITYCRVLLLCRKRPGELERMKLKAYNESESMDSQSYEEFKSCVTPTEAILLKTFKRVVIRGKRKVTPVLFAPDIQGHIELLLSVRANFVTNRNEYLFPNPGTENPIVGYKALGKLAKEAKCKKPEAIKSRSLRKHLATICQLFQMNDNEVEQLSTFMGHSTATHRSNYRLPDDVYQTSKIVKLLVMMEKGEAAEFKGRSINDIDIDLDIEENNGDSDHSDCNTYPRGEIPLEDILLPETSGSVETNTEPIIHSKSKQKKREFHKWTSQQKQIVTKFFEENIKSKSAPKKKQVDKLYEKYRDVNLPNDWKKIKVYVQNVYTKKSKD